MCLLFSCLLDERDGGSNNPNYPIGPPANIKCRPGNVPESHGQTPSPHPLRPSPRPSGGSGLRAPVALPRSRPLAAPRSVGGGVAVLARLAAVAPLSTWVSHGIGDRGRRNAGFAESRRSLGSTPRGVHSKGEGKAGHPERHQTATHDPDDRHGRSQTAGPHPKDRTGPGGGAGQRAEGGALPTCWAGEGRSPHATH